MKEISFFICNNQKLLIKDFLDMRRKKRILATKQKENFDLKKILIEILIFPLKIIKMYRLN